MTTRLEVESAIRELPEVEVRALANWLQEYLEEEWDRQIEDDIESGKLDHLIAKSESDITQLELSRTYDLQTPYDSFGAGAILMETLKQQEIV